MSQDGNLPVYESLQKLVCVVLKAEPEEGLYQVLIKGDNVIAELVCVEALNVGEEVIGLVGSYMDDHYILVADGPEIVKRRDRRRL